MTAKRSEAAAQTFHGILSACEPLRPFPSRKLNAGQARLIRLVNIVAVCLLAVAVPVAPRAMTCIAPHSNLNDALAEAEYVFVGLLATARPAHDGSVIKGTFEVVKEIKGSRLVDPTFETMVNKGSGCGLDVRLGSRYVVFANSGGASIVILPSTMLVDQNDYVSSWVARLLDDKAAW